MFFLFNMIIAYGIMGIAFAAEMPELSLVSSIYSFAILIPAIAVGVRRMHDVGKSGWYLLIPLYNLILVCTDSESRPNKWGDNPKTGGDEINEIGVA